MSRIELHVRSCSNFQLLQACLAAYPFILLRICSPSNFEIRDTLLLLSPPVGVIVTRAYSSCATEMLRPLTSTSPPPHSPPLHPAPAHSGNSSLLPGICFFTLPQVSETIHVFVCLAFQPHHCKAQKLSFVLRLNSIPLCF